jgi:hypothetical protein
VENPDIEQYLAEGVGFEPTVRYKRTTVFKTASLNHSDIPPQSFPYSTFKKDRQKFLFTMNSYKIGNFPPYNEDKSSPALNLKTSGGRNQGGE